MAGFESELALAWCVLLNATVFAAAWRLAIRRPGADRVQAFVDASLIHYSVQYVSVGVPGMLGILGPAAMSAVAVVIAFLLWVAAGSATLTGVPSGTEDERRSARFQRERISLACALFAIAYVGAMVHFQRFLPVTSNDAMTYHFPAAGEWLQTGHIGLFGTWFFNPANTFSPLAGSTFIAWLLAPIGNDVLARFVELPALILCGAALYQISRRLGADGTVAALVATAAVVARPLISHAMAGKDDLFVAAFTLTSLSALRPQEGAAKASVLRLGLSLGLLVAMKYTVVFAFPILLLAVDGPYQSGWRLRHLCGAAIVALVLAGPWYLRNFVATGNPFFPVRIAGMHGLFTTARSDGLATAKDVWRTLTGEFAVPPILLLVFAASQILLIRQRGWSRVFSEPLLRACVFGPVASLLLFAWRSPFPEFRFFVPAVAVLFPCVAAGLSRVRPAPLPQTLAATLVAVCIATAFDARLLANAGRFTLIGFGVAIAGLGIAWVVRAWPARQKLVLVSVGIGGVCIHAFIYWRAYVRQCEDARLGDVAVWGQFYPREAPAWAFIDQNVPHEATIAYSNTYLTYPLQGYNLKRRIGYAPTSSQLTSLTRLPWLGNRISGESVVRLAVQATTTDADRNAWLNNLRALHAEFLIVFKVGPVRQPIESTYAAMDVQRFQKLFEDASATVYRIQESSDVK